MSNPTARRKCVGTGRLSNKGRCPLCGRKFRLTDKMRDKLPRHFATHPVLAYAFREAQA